MNLGNCCACGRTENVRNVLCLDFEAPDGYAGWGCVVCNLPTRGAVAIVCDECLEANAEPKFVAGGHYATEGVRVSLEGFEQRPFKHDDAKHAAMLPESRC